jgi:1-deoxy-D-xylulose-5-phosphate synthase
MIPQVQAAAVILSRQGINVSVVNARFVKPLDHVLLNQILPDARVIVTVEEGALRGGFGQAVAEYLLSHRYAGRFRAFGLPDRFVTHGSRAQLLKELGLDGESLTREIGALAGETAITNETRPVGGGLFKRFVMRRNSDRKDRAENPQISLTGTDSE